MASTQPRWSANAPCAQTARRPAMGRGRWLPSCKPARSAVPQPRRPATCCCKARIRPSQGATRTDAIALAFVRSSTPASQRARPYSSRSDD
ncbi:hypothetical protein XH94_23390 [Bradyrhizobium zhanjiangense]|uniref:Uncharacterized protein n=1 Tax=Bradyrhizobium zhanjiangense TaxID=1325107 RepID=A0A4Q0SGF7_9BRAD|nr:hypothetical protein XH94_23390 [Bradyrhizobium zhanjiangense]